MLQSMKEGSRRRTIERKRPISLRNLRVDSINLMGGIESTLTNQVSHTPGKMKIIGDRGRDLTLNMETMKMEIILDTIDNDQNHKEGVMVVLEEDIAH